MKNLYLMAALAAVLVNVAVSLQAMQDSSLGLRKEYQVEKKIENTIGMLYKAGLLRECEYNQAMNSSTQELYTKLQQHPSFGLLSPRELCSLQTKKEIAELIRSCLSPLKDTTKKTKIMIEKQQDSEELTFERLTFGSPLPLDPLLSPLSVKSEESEEYERDGIEIVRKRKPSHDKGFKIDTPMPLDLGSIDETTTARAVIFSPRARTVSPRDVVERSDSGYLDVILDPELEEQSVTVAKVNLLLQSLNTLADLDTSARDMCDLIIKNYKSEVKLFGNMMELEYKDLASEFKVYGNGLYDMRGKTIEQIYEEFAEKLREPVKRYATLRKHIPGVAQALLNLTGDNELKERCSWIVDDAMLPFVIFVEQKQALSTVNTLNEKRQIEIGKSLRVVNPKAMSLPKRENDNSFDVLLERSQKQIKDLVAEFIEIHKEAYCAATRTKEI